ncbi:hypothetical protein ACJBX6_11380, partial [Streptococcus suis]
VCSICLGLFAKRLDRLCFRQDVRNLSVVFLFLGLNGLVDLGDFSINFLFNIVSIPLSLSLGLIDTVIDGLNSLVEFSVEMAV